MIKSQTTIAKIQARTSRLIFRRNAYRQTYYCVSATDEQFQTTLEALKVKQTFESIPFFTITCDCKKIITWNVEECKDNSQTICTHSMAALIKANVSKHNTVTFFDSIKEASVSGGSLYKLQSNQGRKSYGWIVVKEIVDSSVTCHVDTSYTNSDLVNAWDYPSLDRDFEKAGIASSSFGKRVSMMRGPFEEGIE